MIKLIRSTEQIVIDAQDEVVRRELGSAGIPIESRQVKAGDAVYCTVFGRLSTFSFRRLPAAFEVSGNLVDAAADEIRLHNAFGRTVKWPAWIKAGSSVTRIEVASLDGLKLVASMIRKHCL